jgi:hypothetical protein
MISRVNLCDLHDFDGAHLGQLDAGTGLGRIEMSPDRSLLALDGS